MGLFNKKQNGPYKDESTNLIHELLFCDNLDLYKENNTPKDVFPWNVLFADPPKTADLQKIILDDDTESRVKLLAYNKLRSIGTEVESRDLQGVVVEVGLDDGLDVLASYKDGTARYINHTGKMIIWEARDQVSSEITQQLFRDSSNIVNRIGPWNKPRLPYPVKGNVRISFLVSDGIYFGEGPINTMFNDPIAAPALSSATALMQYLTNKSLE